MIKDHKTDLTVSRWNWLFFPVGLTVAYALITCVWASLRRPDIVSKAGSSYVAWWEGQVMGFALIRLFVAVLLSLPCFMVTPRRRFEPALTGVLTGLGVSVLDRYLFDWVNEHAGFAAALCVIPLLVGGLVILSFGVAFRPGTPAANDEASLT